VERVQAGLCVEPQRARLTRRADARVHRTAGWGVFQYHWVQLPVTEENKHLDTITPAIAWCEEYLGKSGSKWFEKKKKFYFRDEKDMTLFILKFCS
jgi:hypothetical protein